MVKNAKLKEKQKWSNEELHLENARKFLGIYFFDSEDKEFKETIKNARKKLETPIALAMPCINLKKIVGVVHPTKLKQDLRVFWKLMNPEDCVWKTFPQQRQQWIRNRKIGENFGVGPDKSQK